MIHEGESYVNLFSNSPVNTCCPSYRVHDFDFLDDTLEVSVTCHKSDNSNILCPVQIHVNSTKENPAKEKNLLNFDSDDELFDRNYILIDEDRSFDITPKRNPYPDANSHSNYNLLHDVSRSISPFRPLSLDIPYSIANSHRHTQQVSNSHSNYEVFSDVSEKNELTSYENGSSYSMANSHGVYKILSESSDWIGENHSTERLIPTDDHNYEIANSHSNYQIFYNSQTQHEIKTNLMNKVHKNISEREAVDAAFNGLQLGQLEELIQSEMARLSVVSPRRSESSHSSIYTEEISMTCGIEECLIQIEESLLNIEKNLRHVQDLDIPELKHLLYKSPSIEKSLFEVKDLLSTESIKSVKRREIFSPSYEESRVHNTIDNIFKDEHSQDSNPVVFTNEENPIQFADDKSVSDFLPSSVSVPSALSSISFSNDRNVNFICNSLSRTPTRNNLSEARENIRMCFSEEDVGSDYKNLDFVNYNYNNIAQKKLCAKKCHSRSNSLDENSIFQPMEFQYQQKTSLENLFSERDQNFENKAKSEYGLEQYEIRRNLKTSKFKRSRVQEECYLAEVEAKAEEFRRKIENIIESRRSTHPDLENKRRLTKNSLESPQIRLGSSNVCDNEKDKDCSDNKILGHERRKRKKLINRTPAEANAMVPSKLISLSLSLLLAALLQAVRCLTDLVEDAFKSISYDRNGLLQ